MSPTAVLDEIVDQADPEGVVGYVGASAAVRRCRAAADALGIELVVHTTTGTPDVGGGSLDDVIDRAAVITLGHGCDAATFARLCRDADDRLRPHAPTVRFAHDRLTSRYVLEGCGFELVEWEEVDAGDTDAVRRFGHDHGWPVRLTPVAWGHQRSARDLVHEHTDLDARWAGFDGHLWVVEACEQVASRRSVTLVRRPSGQCVLWEPGVRGGSSRDRRRGAAPASAVAVAMSLVDGLDATGVVTVEFLEPADRRLLVDQLVYGPEHHDTVGTGDAVAALYEAHLCAVLDRPLDRLPG